MSVTVGGLEDIRIAVEETFRAAAEEALEPGMASLFSRMLLDLVRRESADALAAIEDVIRRPRTSSELAAEALRWLGHLDHPPSCEARLQLLIRGLESPSARVRDAASIGLALLDDPAAIPALRRATEAEADPGLREDLAQVLDQLEQTRSCR